MADADTDPNAPPGRRRADRALLRGDFAGAARAYARLLTGSAAPEPGLVFNLSYARRQYRAARRDQPLRIAACGWEMSHNAAGRVRALADLHAEIGRVEMIGAVFDGFGEGLWPPIRGGPHPVHLTRVTDPRTFPRRALDLVLRHPYDVVHLSKPRMPNILVGLFYKLVWDARVIVDVDDEELAFVNAGEPLPLDDLLTAQGGRPDWSTLRRRDWTRAGVGLAGIFDALTVSNVALQARYPGVIVPHARPGRMRPSPALRAQGRARHGIAQDEFVVLFVGTPRAHKGLVETGEALARLGRRDVCFVIAGDFADPALKARLEGIPGLRLRFLPNQPYDRLAEFVAIGDACALLQDDGLAARFQFPAKLVDALAMGLLTVVRPTPPLQPAIRDGAVLVAGPETLDAALAPWLDDPAARARQCARGRDWFERHLSSESCLPALARIVRRPRDLPPLGVLLADGRQSDALARLGWLRDMARLRA